jgi:flagellar biosynthesis protein FlhF
MHVRKFEGDSLDEVIAQVKRDLGPDAIILKTKSHKGLSGAFKKNRIEITAAISETSYLNKSKLDNVLDGENREKFYKKEATEVKRTIDSYSQNQTAYGSMGLNRSVQQKKEQTSAPQASSSGLDAFLSSTPKKESQPTSSVQLHEFISDIGADTTETIVEKPALSSAPKQIDKPTMSASADYTNKLAIQEERIRDLEHKLTALMEDVSFSKQTNRGPEGIEELASSLRTLDINERITQDLLKKIRSKVNHENQSDPEVVFDVALHELNSRINTSRPMFSNDSEGAKITVFISEGAAGQSSCIYKLASINPDSTIIKYNNDQNSKVEKLLGLDCINVDKSSEIIGHCRKKQYEESNLFIDVNPNQLNGESLKELIENLKRNFNNVEVLLSISSIHSEIYNRKIFSKYSNLADGIIINHIDKCLNYGALLNLHFEFNELPIVFFGTGRVIPEDIEAATSERLLSLLFKLV